MKYDCMILLPKDQYSTLIKAGEGSDEKKDGADSIYDLKDSKVTNVKVNDGGLVLLQSSAGQEKSASSSSSSSVPSSSRSSGPSEDGGQSGEGRVRGGPKGKKGKTSAVADPAADDGGRAMMTMKHKYNPRGIRVVQQRASAAPTKDPKSLPSSGEDVKQAEKRELTRRILAARRRLPLRRKRHLQSDDSLVTLPPIPSDWSEDPKRRRMEEKMEMDRLIDMRLNQLRGLPTEEAAYTLNTREGHQPGPIARVVNPPLFVPHNIPTYDDPQMMVEKMTPSDSLNHRYEDVPMVDASYYRPEPLAPSVSSDEKAQPIPMDTDPDIDARKEDAPAPDEEIVLPSSEALAPSQKRPLAEEDEEVEGDVRRPSKVSVISQKRPMEEDEFEHAPSPKKSLAEEKREVEQVPRRRRPHQLKALPPPDSAAAPPVRGKLGYQISQVRTSRGEAEKGQTRKRHTLKRSAHDDVTLVPDDKIKQVKRAAPKRALADDNDVIDEKKKVKHTPAHDDDDDDEKKKKKGKRPPAKKRDYSDEEDGHQLFPGYSSYYKRARPDEDFAFGKRKRSIFSDGNRRPAKRLLSDDIRDVQYPMWRH